MEQKQLSKMLHDLSQPLCAALLNIKALQYFIEQNPIDVDESKEILSDILQEQEKTVVLLNKVRDYVNTKKP